MIEKAETVVGMGDMGDMDLEAAPMVLLRGEAVFVAPEAAAELPVELSFFTEF
ncbi:MAG: hypothetical protein HY399_03185 [Elusimicrobia bacterium]|nr:hypothetical protein [Elusimicrobiota bacterium]